MVIYKKRINFNYPNTKYNIKTLKITLITALFFASLTSCTEQDLNEDNVLSDNTTEEAALIRSGGADD